MNKTDNIKVTDETPLPVAPPPAPVAVAPLPIAPAETPAESHYRWVQRMRSLGVSAQEDQETGEDLMAAYDSLSDSGKLAASILVGLQSPDSPGKDENGDGLKAADGLQTPGDVLGL